MFHFIVKGAGWTMKSWTLLSRRSSSTAARVPGYLLTDASQHGGLGGLRRPLSELAAAIDKLGKLVRKAKRRRRGQAKYDSWQ